MTKNILIGDIVNTKTITINIHETIQNAAFLISKSEASDLMVIDQKKNFVGVLSEGDLIRAVMPNLKELMDSSEGTLEKAYRVFLEVAKDIGQQPIGRLVIYDPILLAPNDELLKAAIVMVTKQIRRLPVVESNKFIGTVSRADICKAILFANPF
jgi:CBS domain-containing protein